MKKIILTATAVLILFSCSRNSSSENLLGKSFYGVAYASCFPTEVTNLTPDEYYLIYFLDEDGNEISYQPKPNTWYRMCFGSACTWIKTGNDVSPQDSFISDGIYAIEYTSPCQ